MTTNMLPFDKRVVDAQYHDLMDRAFNHPDDVQKLPLHENSKTRIIFGHLLRFPIENGVPVITERDISKLFHGAIGEMLSFRDGVRTYKEMSEKYGCKFWRKWVTKEQCAIFGLPEGDLGAGSYGPAWTQPVIDAGGKPISQIEALMNQMRDYPRSLTHRLTNWMPNEVLQWEGRKRTVVVAPCHGDVSFFFNPDSGFMNMHHEQRVADVGSGLPFNFIHYVALGMMVAQVLGYTFKELVYTIRHGEIYQEQHDAISELLDRKPRRLPTIRLDPTVKNLFDFRPEHFTLEDYDPHPAMRVPTPL